MALDYKQHSKTSPPKLTWEQRVALAQLCNKLEQSPHWLQWDASNSPKTAHNSPSTITAPSNTPIPRPTPLTTPNGIRVHPMSHFATVHFPDIHTHRPNRPTDRQTDSPTDGIGDRDYNISAYDRYIDRERRANNKENNAKYSRKPLLRTSYICVYRFLKKSFHKIRCRETSPPCSYTPGRCRSSLVEACYCG